MKVSSRLLVGRAAVFDRENGGARARRLCRASTSRGARPPSHPRPMSAASSKLEIIGLAREITREARGSAGLPRHGPQPPVLAQQPGGAACSGSAGAAARCATRAGASRRRPQLTPEPLMRLLPPEEVPLLPLPVMSELLPPVPPCVVSLVTSSPPSRKQRVR